MIPVLKDIAHLTFTHHLSPSILVRERKAMLSLSDVKAPLRRGLGN